MDALLSPLLAALPWLGWLLFAALGLACVLLVPLGVPGTWLLIGLAVVVELVDGVWLRTEPALSFGWAALGIAAALGGLGELVETAAGAAGSRLGGGSRSGMLGAFLGGIAGAIAGTALVPIPLLGTLLGSLAGTFLGAWLGELRAEQRRQPRETFRAAAAAAAGRLVGTLGKSVLAVAVWVVLVRAAWPASGL